MVHVHSLGVFVDQAAIHQDLLKRKCGEEAGNNNLSNPMT